MTYWTLRVVVRRLQLRRWKQMASEPAMRLLQLKSEAMRFLQLIFGPRTQQERESHKKPLN